jgi:hypothetical protein
MEGVRDYDSYFRCKPDATGKIGFTSYQRYFSAIRMLAYGVEGDLIDEYLRMSKTTCLDSMNKFCKAMIVIFNEVYLRGPNVVESALLLSINWEKGFPEMIESIYCMHWE